MTDIHLASHGQTSKQKPLAALYWDLQNVSLIQKLANSLLAFANSQWRLSCKKVYYNSQCKDQDSAKDALHNLGFKCFDVPCALKNSADNQLIADCLEDVDNYLSPEIVILISGDGDFKKLVSILQKVGKKVIVFAQRGNVKQKLKEIADEFHFVDELPELIVDKAQPQTTSIQSQITYEDAIEYLIKAIKILGDKGKPALLSRVNNLMCKNQEIFPNYKGVSSILKPDGKTFLKFSKFVDAVVKDGKIRKQGQELFLL